MKRVALLVLLLASVAALLQCSGGKALTVDQYHALPTAEKISYLERQTASNPGDIPLRKQLYREYLDADMIPQAIATMEEIVQLDPYEIDVQFEYGELQYKSANYQPAYRAFRSVLQSASGSTYQEKIANYVAGSYLVQQVTSDQADEGFPTFSPDGSKLLFQKRQGNNWDVVELDLGTQAQTPLLASAADEELPSYSPDGTRIVYTSNASDRRPVEANYKVREIALTHLSDRYTTNLTLSVADDWLPRFSHSGSHILFVSERGDLRDVGYGAKQSDVFIMEEDGDFQQQLTMTPFNEGGACFSGDDKHVYFHSNANGNYDVFVIKADGTQQMTVIDNAVGDDLNPCASPSSDQLAFVSNRDGNYEIYLANSTGTTQERLTFSTATDTNPVFSPDGNTIAFHSDRNGNYDIFLINLEYPATDLSSDDLLDRLNRMIN